MSGRGSPRPEAGGLARAAKLDPERREAIAIVASEAKWSALREGKMRLDPRVDVRLAVSLRLSGALAADLVEVSREEGLSLSRIATRSIAEWLVRRSAGKKGDRP